MLFKQIFILWTVFNLSVPSTGENLTMAFTQLNEGLIEIMRRLPSSSIAILLTTDTSVLDITEFLRGLHGSSLNACVFSDNERFFAYIEENLRNAVEVNSLIFTRPDDIINEVHIRNLGHRLSLFFFYCNIKDFLRYELNLREPIRVAVIAHPIKNIFRIYYNQARPDGLGNLRLVNIYNGDSMIFNKHPLLPSATTVYRNFNGRVLYIPVVHSPPWFFVNYLNDTFNDTSAGCEYCSNSSMNGLVVNGGRDDHLVKLLAQKMNFKYEYIDLIERTQGAIKLLGDNVTFSGGLGMIQKREADIFLGDIPVSWERMKAVDFTFFTLADSGAFITHAPKRLNEAFALIRPFRFNVWPALFLTIAISGPMLYLVIIIPMMWTRPSDRAERQQFNNSITENRSLTMGKIKKVETNAGNSFHHISYIKEMRHEQLIERNRNKKIDFRKENNKAMRSGGRMRNGRRQDIRATHLTKRNGNGNGNKMKLLSKCIWFTINIYLCQSAEFDHKGHRVRFLIILLWLSATYVIGDLYSSSLTSQLAKPAREAPINTIYKLEDAMQHKGYELFVERQSASYAMLANGSGTFQRLFCMMGNQRSNKRLNGEKCLVSNVEEGVQIVMDGSFKKVLFGGRETLYFNMRRYGIHNFQISEKLYTRYSSIAVQIGCPYLHSLNEILMGLFEGGIMEKMTNAEYENMFASQEALPPQDSLTSKGGYTLTTTLGDRRSSDSRNSLQPVNLRILQGAFFVLCLGYTLATLAFLGERQCNARNWLRLKRICRKMKRKFLRIYK